MKTMEDDHAQKDTLAVADVITTPHTACQLPANQNGQESNLAGEYWYGVSG